MLILPYNFLLSIIFFALLLNLFLKALAAVAAVTVPIAIPGAPNITPPNNPPIGTTTVADVIRYNISTIVCMYALDNGILNCVTASFVDIYEFLYKVINSKNNSENLRLISGFILYL